MHCYACGHNCPLPDGAAGVCKVRFNRGGTLYVPWGYVGGVQCDPIEKKPFFHVDAGQPGLQLRHAGLRSALLLLPELGDVAGAARPRAVAPPRTSSPEMLVREAARARGALVVSTYNEPLITAEWAVEIFAARPARGLLTAFVSNGNGTPQVLDYHPAAPRLLQGRSEVVRRSRITASLGDGSRPSSTRSARFTRAACGSRSSRCSCRVSTTRRTR